MEQLPAAVKAERLQRLHAEIDRSQRAFSESRVGTVAEVLFERRGRHPGQIVGRAPWLQPVQVDGEADLVGTIARVTITETGPNSLFGRLADREALPAGVIA
jgi:tRNA-2-methylthio-N6-dimethylallyladenosine synthase